MNDDLMEWDARVGFTVLFNIKQIMQYKMAFLELTISPCMDVDTNNHGH
jgi:hypothetical protein